MLHTQYMLTMQRGSQAGDGVVTAEPDRWVTLEDLVAEADAMLYRQKQKKKGIA